MVFKSLFMIITITILHKTTCIKNTITNVNLELNNEINEQLEEMINYYKDKINNIEIGSEFPKNENIVFIQNKLQSDIPFTWNIYNTTNNGPSPRRGHSALIADNYMVVFGGCYLESKCFNDVYFLDLISNEWQHIQTSGSTPSPRQGHSAIMYGSNMWIYGGSSNDGFFNDFYSLNLETV